ncbi:MAG: hypothetical protein JWM82_638 [Myxococcales bacterium]|nr:hypothetical protein [Myxococcales bacterium]
MGHLGRISLSLPMTVSAKTRAAPRAPDREALTHQPVTPVVIVVEVAT